MTNWLEKVVALNVKVSSLWQYKVRLETYIATHFENEKIQEITRAMVDKFMIELTGLGLVKNTLSNVHSLLSQALDYAVYPAQIITFNPERKYPFGSSMYIPLLLYHTEMKIGEICGIVECH